jgi:hypothetical protein
MKDASEVNKNLIRLEEKIVDGRRVKAKRRMKVSRAKCENTRRNMTVVDKRSCSIASV